jgi:starch phosphorylase
MEFLIGKLIKSNMHNLGVYDIVNQTFKDFDIDIKDVEACESDAGLGNGGLGRLAACYMDSSASLGLPVFGNSIRYSHGYFIQSIVNNKQVELPDNWLDNPFFWETRLDDQAREIPFYGRIENHQYVDQVWVKAVPYDIDVIGKNNLVINKLRIWSAEKSDKYEEVDEIYARETSQISDVLYPNDSTTYGKLLRIKQQYFFSAAGVQSALKQLIDKNISLLELPDYYCFQINDTHPTLIIPELLRILIDEHQIPYDDAWSIVTKTVAYTNHTILQEALEKWPIDLIRSLLPRIYELIEEIDRRLRIELDTYPKLDSESKYRMNIIGSSSVRMANLAIYGSFSINGVAKLHSTILKQETMKEFYSIYPKKFNNKTNGVTQRRFMMDTNTSLTNFITQKIGKSWLTNFNQLSKLEDYANDDETLEQLKLVKRSQKVRLSQLLKKEYGIELNVDSIFDIQVKRLHEYKRQMLNILHIIHLYLKLRSDDTFRANYYPHTFIFGAKAAPSYYIAKKTIELINYVSDKIASDPKVNKLLKVVFIPNYNVSLAEYLITACDVSEQISTASKEASGTGNMKFMLNGALTVGTLDGANVEIHDLVGDENCYIFGLKAEEVISLYKQGNYKPYELYLQNQDINDAIEYISHLSQDKYLFEDLKNNLLNSDSYLVFKDFESYIQVHEQINEDYKNSKLWFKKALINIARSSFFSSDRAVKEYNKDIWHLKKVTLK